jgi:XTP/dITP diphosphohydrolase
MPFKLPPQILIATNNQGKFIEIQDLLKQINIEAVSVSKFNLQEPDETEKTFAGNALIKAKFYGKNSGLVALADDSGLCIEALDGAPGVDSAPFAIDEKTGQKNFPKAFEKIKNLLLEKGINPNSNPKAHFICNLCLFDPNTDFTIHFEGRVDGSLSFLSHGNKGFGYDPIFIKEGMTQSFSEIDPKLKDQISHRGDAFRKMLEFLA